MWVILEVWGIDNAGSKDEFDLFVWLLLQSNLVDEVKAGDDAIITGVLIKRWRKANRDSRPEVSLAIVANSVQIKNYSKSN